jgi:hypothetical protein
MWRKAQELHCRPEYELARMEPKLVPNVDAYGGGHRLNRRLRLMTGIQARLVSTAKDTELGAQAQIN